MFRSESWSMPSKNSVASPGAEGFGESRGSKYAGNSRAIHSSHSGIRGRSGRDQGAAHNRVQAQKADAGPHAEAVEMEAGTSQVVDCRDHCAPCGCGSCRELADALGHWRERHHDPAVRSGLMGFRLRISEAGRQAVARSLSRVTREQSRHAGRNPEGNLGQLRDAPGTREGIDCPPGPHVRGTRYQPRSADRRHCQATQEYEGEEKEAPLTESSTVLPNTTKPSVVGAAPAGAQDQYAAARAVREMFTSIAPRYDLLNHVLSFNVDRIWWRRTARAFRHIVSRPDARILDLCCGTGDMTFALRQVAGKSHPQILGADFSHA